MSMKQPTKEEMTKLFETLRRHSERGGMPLRALVINSPTFGLFGEPPKPGRVVMEFDLYHVPAEPPKRKKKRK